MQIYEPIGLYSWLKPLLFQVPPEHAHNLSLNMLRWGGRFGVVRSLIHKAVAPAYREETTIFGHSITNRIGIAAGYDKNAAALNGLEAMGFGHIEVGTVTPRPQPGNNKPRIAREPSRSALVNRLGFPSEGMEVVAKRLESFCNKPEKKAMIGINIGKNKTTPNDQAYKDYCLCFEKLVDFADYMVINISSPNTPDLRQLQHVHALESLLTPILALRSRKDSQVPILVKFSPDLSQEACLLRVDKVVEMGIDGIVLSNTRKVKVPLEGGLSGLPLREETLRRVGFLRKAHPSLKIIASGGIGLDGDVERFIKAGADLIQIYTALVYRGPMLLKYL